MAKLPDDTALGAAPGLNSGRPIASIDTSVIGKGIAALGKGVSDLGEGLGAAAHAQDEYDLAKRASVFETERVKLDSQFDQDRDFGTRQQRYTEAMGKLRAKTIEGASPRVADWFTLRTDPVVAKAEDHQKDIAFKQDTDHRIAQTTEGGANLIDAGAGSDDRDARARLIETQHDRIDALKNEGRVSEQQALAMKQAWVHRFATTDFIIRSQRDPEGALDDLRTAPGSPAEKVNRILSIEGYGKNAKSSATGAGQFINSTWLDTIRRYRPDLAEGKSDAEILDLRADRNLGKEMTARYAEQNDAYLKRSGIEVTPGATYLAHFLGPKGAAAVLKADPGRAVIDVLSEAVGEKAARQMVEANPSIMLGRQAGSVVQWSDSKMGGSDRIQMYRMLPPEVRAQMEAHGEQQLRHQRVDDAAGFKSRVEDSLSEAARTGNVSKPIGQWEFIARAGYADGKKAYDGYLSDIQLGKDAAGLSEMSPEQQRNVIDSYTPAPGADGFADTSKRQEILLKALQKVAHEKKDDPAKFAMNRLPAVQAAKGALDLMQSDPHASPSDKQAAARKFADVMMFEQQRVGVPPEQRSLVSKDYVHAFSARLNDPKSVGGAGNVAQMIQQEAQLWGDRWPDVYKHIAKKGGNLAIVIGSGVTPEASAILAEHANTSIGEIANDQDTTRLTNIKNDVRTAFRPLSASFTGNEGAQPVIDAFQHAGEKLAAFYVRGGMTSSDAATKAFEGLLGHKYNFVGSAGWLSTNWAAGDRYRVPKNLPLDDIKRGAEIAKANLEAYDIAPVKGYPGSSPDYDQRETLRRYARDGVWVTAPGDVGLALAHGDQAPRNGAGGPVILPWAYLAQLGHDDRSLAARAGFTVGSVPERLLSGAAGASGAGGPR